VAQERQPGGAIGVLSRPVVMGKNPSNHIFVEGFLPITTGRDRTPMAKNPSNHIFVDLDVERQGDLLCDSRTAPIGITLLHFDDRMNEICARSFRTGLPTAIRGEKHPVLLLAQDFMKP